VVRDHPSAGRRQRPRGTLDITDWLLWFLACLARAIDGADATRGPILRKADFWQRHAGQDLNPRQRLVLNRYVDGFAGKLTARKWAAFGKCSIPTAQRDINDLLECGMLKRNAGGEQECELRGGVKVVSISPMTAQRLSDSNPSAKGTAKQSSTVRVPLRRHPKARRASEVWSCMDRMSMLPQRSTIR